MKSTVTSTGRLKFLPRAGPFEPPISYVKKSTAYTFFGHFNTLLTRDLRIFSTAMVEGADDPDATVAEVEAALLDFLQQTWLDRDGEEECCWFKIFMYRAKSRPGLDSVFPGWHIDPPLNTVSHRRVGKAAELSTTYSITWLGPTSICLDLPTSFSDARHAREAHRDVRDLMTQVDSIEMSTVARALVHEYFSIGHAPVIRPQVGQIARYRYGDGGVVASPPDLNGLQLVHMSIIFDTEEEIKTYCHSQKALWAG